MFLLLFLMHTHISPIILLLLRSSLRTGPSTSNWGEETVINKIDTVHWAYTATRQTVNRWGVSKLPLVGQNCLSVVNEVYSYARFMHYGRFFATMAELSGCDSSLHDPPKWKYLLSGPWHKSLPTSKIYHKLTIILISVIKRNLV